MNVRLHQHPPRFFVTQGHGARCLQIKHNFKGKSLPLIHGLRLHRDRNLLEDETVWVPHTKLTTACFSPTWSHVPALHWASLNSWITPTCKLSSSSPSQSCVMLSRWTYSKDLTSWLTSPHIIRHPPFIKIRRKHPPLWVLHQTYFAFSWKTMEQFLPKVHILLPYEKFTNRSWKCILCTEMSTVTSFITVQMWKPPRCPWVGEGTDCDGQGTMQICHHAWKAMSKESLMCITKWKRQIWKAFIL